MTSGVVRDGSRADGRPKRESLDALPPRGYDYSPSATLGIAAVLPTALRLQEWGRTGAFTFGMTPKEFCYWLWGHFEISKSKSMSVAQVQMVKRHLALVFTNVTEPIPDEEFLDLDKIFVDAKRIAKRKKEPTYCSQHGSDELIC